MNDSRAKIALINLWNCTYNYKADGNWLFSIFQADYFNSYSRDAGYTVKRNLDHKGSQMGQIYKSQRLARSSGSGTLFQHKFSRLEAINTKIGNKYISEKTYCSHYKELFLGFECNQNTYEKAGFHYLLR